MKIGKKILGLAIWIANSIVMNLRVKCNDLKSEWMGVCDIYLHLKFFQKRIWGSLQIKYLYCNKKIEKWTMKASMSVIPPYLGKLLLPLTPTM